MQDLYAQIGLAAGSSLPVLIRGQTGTGKELVARAIHRYSDRGNKPFIAINCNAIPDSLLENELFGHEPGAFTGASKRYIGKFEQANGGTLFLDEIGDLTISSQVKLLRVIQERCIERIGGHTRVPLNLQILAATHRDLEGLRSTGHFRDDLFHRLDGFTVKVPCLSDHPTDVPELARHFLGLLDCDARSCSFITPEALKFFEQQPWPGNVRQLHLAVQRSALLARGQIIELTHARDACMQNASDSISLGSNLESELVELVRRAMIGKVEHLRAAALELAERNLFKLVLPHTGGNQSRLAELLGITRATARRRARQLRLPLQDDSVLQASTVQGATQSNGQSDNSPPGLPCHVGL
jgi:two-component system nitrogen regulation response regulator GlnG